MGYQLVFFAVLLSAALVHVAGQAGFLSIDCGLDANFSSYVDTRTGITYVPDGPYVDAGVNHRIASAYDLASRYRYSLTLRSFPDGERNCYTLPTGGGGGKYLARAEFLYGDYDGKNGSASSVQFDLYIGVNYWDTVYVRPNSCASTSCFYEVVFVAAASWTPVCLVNTGRGTPFVSVLELRPLGALTYPLVTANQSLAVHSRLDYGADSFTRYPTDPHDRFWSANPSPSNISTAQPVQPDKSFDEPSSVLQTAETPTGNGTAITYSWFTDQSATRTRPRGAFLHIADFQSSQVRRFDVYLNGNKQQGPYNPLYLTASSITAGPYTAADGQYNLTVVATTTSALPPILNALEIYSVIAHSNLATYTNDVDAIMPIKAEYGIKKNWMGDPCFSISSKIAWDGLRCNSASGEVTRITYLDLSSNNLRGVVSTNFTSLKALEYLDLSYNNLTGPIPEFLASFPSLKVLNLSGNHLNGPIPYSLCQKSASGSLNFRYESSGDLCNKTIASSSKSKTVLTIVSVVVPVMVVAVLLLVVCVGWQKRRKSRDAVPNPTSYKDLWSDNGPRSRTSHGDPLLNSENKNNRRFTYKQLEMFTNKFERFIGKGGFGPVYYGRLEDGTEVAVKMRAESSSHGIDEFLAEVQSLRTVHHRNLVSLVGYCCEDDHLALVYEYMSQGNLWDHLRGKSGFPEMNWGVRLQAVLGAAQGLDYLHQGCSLPIIHRDVKSSNILLDQNLQAKIADFGLCKTYASEMQTHISTNAAGSAGYFDPEYFHTGRLTKSSDVYSFGVVLLEVATGEPPILPGHGHIVQRVKQGIAAGDISSIADARLGGAYDVSSMWKVVDTAMACTADTADRRPTMAAVVAQLKESLALEEARENRGFMEGPVSDTAALVSTFGPSAR